MPIKPKEAELLISSGKSEESINRFITKALKDHFESCLGECDSQSIDDAFVAALALRMLMKKPETRNVLGLKRLPRGKSFEIDDFLKDRQTGDQALTIAEQLIRKEITKGVALSKLGDILTEYFGTAPENPKTLNRVLNDLVDRAIWLETTLQQFVDIYADGCPETAEKIMLDRVPK